MNEGFPKASAAMPQLVDARTVDPRRGGQNAPLFIHVGLPKTATSALQQVCLPTHPEIDYHALPRKGGRSDPEGAFDAFVRWVRRSPDLVFERPKHARFVRTLLATGPLGARCRVLSEERFTGHFGAGIPAKAELARDLFPEAQIVIVVRNPYQLLISNYLQHLRNPRPGMPPVPGFGRWIEESLVGSSTSYLPAVRIHDIVCAYEAGFGSERVHVLLYEELADTPAAFLTRLSVLLGVSPEPFLGAWGSRGRIVNPSPTRLQFLLWRLRQPWFNGGPRALATGLTRAAGVASRIPWRPAFKVAAHTRRLIDSVVAEQCRALEASRQLGLWRHRYPGFEGVAAKEPAGTGSQKDCRDISAA